VAETIVKTQNLEAEVEEEVNMVEAEVLSPI